MTHFLSTQPAPAAYCYRMHDYVVISPVLRQQLHRHLDAELPAAVPAAGLRDLLPEMQTRCLELSDIETLGTLLELLSDLELLASDADTRGPLYVELPQLGDDDAEVLLPRCGSGSYQITAH